VVFIFSDVINPPTFNTDLDAFTPDSEEYSAHERIHQNFPNESRPMFVNIEVDDESNILTIDNIQLMLEHYEQLKLLSEKTVITTGIGIFFSKLSVEALKALQNSIILTPLCPRAGPTGGDGFAAPAGMFNFI